LSLLLSLLLVSLLLSLLELLFRLLLIWWLLAGKQFSSLGIWP
jgi:hypothetical protein